VELLFFNKKMETKMPEVHCNDEIVIAGVPEHFNYPWQIALKNSSSNSTSSSCFGDLKIRFQEVPEGTGALIEGLKSGKWHIALALTEGLVKDVANGSDIRLLGTYVESPLCWAISAGSTSELKTDDDLKGKKIGISRFTSGSHLMACVLAMQKGWNFETDLEFVVNNNFKKLRDSVNDGSSDAFMWETFMTKPYHDSKEVKRIGQIYTPWPCFMMASTNEYIKGHEEDIKNIFAGIQLGIAKFYQDPETTSRLSEKFGLTVEDAAAWLQTADIVGRPQISATGLQSAIDALQTLKLIPLTGVEPKHLVYENIAKLVSSPQPLPAYQEIEEKASLD